MILKNIWHDENLSKFFNIGLSKIKPTPIIFNFYDWKRKYVFVVIFIKIMKALSAFVIKEDFGWGFFCFDFCQNFGIWIRPEAIVKSWYYRILNENFSIMLEPRILKLYFKRKFTCIKYIVIIYSHILNESEGSSHRSSVFWYCY